MSVALRLFCAATLLAIVGCSDDSDSVPEPMPPIEPPEPPATSLDETGIYTGTLEGSAGEVALLRIVLARSGETSVTLQEDDTEQATRIALGATEGDAEALTTDADELLQGAALSLQWSVTEGSGSVELEADGLMGSADVSRLASSDEALTADEIAGTYLGAVGLQLELTAAGDAEVTGACTAEGSWQQPDAAVNVLLVTVDGDCGELTALGFLDTLETPADVLVLEGGSDTRPLSVDLFRQ